MKKLALAFVCAVAIVGCPDSSSLLTEDKGLVPELLEEGALNSRSSLEWKWEDEAIGYQLQIADSQNNVIGEKIINVSESFYNLGSNLLAKKTLYWRVRAITKIGEILPWREIQVYSQDAEVEQEQQNDKKDGSGENDKSPEKDDSADAKDKEPTGPPVQGDPTVEEKGEDDRKKAEGPSVDPAANIKNSIPDPDDHKGEVPENPGEEEGPKDGENGKFPEKDDAPDAKDKEPIGSPAQEDPMVEEKGEDDRKGESSDKPRGAKQENKGDEVLYLDPEEIGSQKWIALRNELFGRNRYLAISLADYNLWVTVEYCNRRSLTEGRSPVYSFIAGKIGFMPEANGYRLPPNVEWEDREYDSDDEDNPQDRDETGWGGYQRVPFGRLLGQFFGKEENNSFERPNGGRFRGHKRHRQGWDGTINLLSPAKGVKVASTVISFEWEPVENAIGYQVEIHDARRMAVILHAAETKSVKYLNSQLPNGLYHWRARAIGPRGEKGRWSNFHAFQKRWGILSGMKPANRARLTDRTPELSWNTVKDAASYQVQIGRRGSSFRASKLIEIQVPSYTPDTPLNITQYFWRVRPIDAEGQAGIWSKAPSFHIVWNDEVTGLTPGDGKTLADPSPTFSWNPVEGASGYQMQIADDEAELNAAGFIELGEPAYTPPQPLGAGARYFWRVRAVRNKGDFGSWTKTLSLSIDMLDTVTGLYPLDNAVTYGIRQSFSWDSVDGAARYQIRMASGTASIEKASLVDVPSGVSYTPSTDLSQGLWYWQVRGVSEKETYSKWSSLSKITVGDGSLELISPVNAMNTFTQTPRFSWSGAEGAQSYRVQIVSEGTGFADVASITVDNGREYIPADSEALAFGRYSWRVQAVDLFGNHGNWSEEWPFNIAVSTISGMTPLYSASDAETVELSWNPVQYAREYEIQISNDKSQLDGENALIRVDSPRHQPGGLNLYEGYFWRTRALDEGDNPGEWSQTGVLAVYDEARHTGANDIITLADGVQFNTIESLYDGFIFVPGGTFMMGEHATHRVTVSSFSISPLEETHEEILQFLNDHYVDIEINDVGYGYNLTMNDVPIFLAGSNYPVDIDGSGSQRVVFTGGRYASDLGVSGLNFSWYGAVQYANWLSEQRDLEKVYTIGTNGPEDISVDWDANGYRLPTEAEWEFAGRGGLISGGYLYAGSDDIDDVAWYRDTTDVGRITHTGAELMPNELNLYDMSGNLSEFCWDWLAFNYDYSRSGETDPTGPDKDFILSIADRYKWGRTIKGGSRTTFGDQLYVLRPGFSFYTEDGNPISSGGIRLVRRGLR